MSDKHTKYEAVKYLKPKGKRGQTFKGLLTQVRKLKGRGKSTQQL